MQCKSSAGQKPVCKAGKCQCAKKSGGDSAQDTVRLMKARLSGSVTTLPGLKDGEMYERVVHFGQAVRHLIQHFSVCTDSAKTRLRDFHNEKHLQILPSVEEPLYVRFDIAE